MAFSVTVITSNRIVNYTLYVNHALFVDVGCNTYSDNSSALHIKLH